MCSESKRLIDRPKTSIDRRASARLKLVAGLALAAAVVHPGSELASNAVSSPPWSTRRAGSRDELAP